MSCRNLIQFLISPPFFLFLQNPCSLVTKPRGLSCLCWFPGLCQPGQDSWAPRDGAQAALVGAHNFISEIYLNSSSLVTNSAVKAFSGISRTTVLSISCEVTFERLVLLCFSLERSVQSHIDLGICRGTSLGVFSLEKRWLKGDFIVLCTAWKEVVPGGEWSLLPSKEQQE